MNRDIDAYRYKLSNGKQQTILKYRTAFLIASYSADQSPHSCNIALLPYLLVTNKSRYAILSQSHFICNMTFMDAVWKQ